MVLKKSVYTNVDKIRSSHALIVGPTRYGKGILTGCMLYQATQRGDAVVVIDPKGDEKTKK